MDLAILGAKEKFLRGTSLLIPPKLEQNIDNITDKFYSYSDIDSIRERQENQLVILIFIL